MDPMLHTSFEVPPCPLGLSEGAQGSPYLICCDVPESYQSMAEVDGGIKDLVTTICVVSLTLDRVTNGANLCLQETKPSIHGHGLTK